MSVTTTRVDCSSPAETGGSVPVRADRSAVAGVDSSATDLVGMTVGPPGAKFTLGAWGTGVATSSSIGVGAIERPKGWGWLPVPCCSDSDATSQAVQAAVCFFSVKNVPSTWLALSVT